MVTCGGATNKKTLTAIERPPAIISTLPGMLPPRETAIGWPHLGHEAAAGETWLAQAGHAVVVIVLLDFVVCLITPRWSCASTPPNVPILSLVAPTLPPQANRQ